MWNKINKHIIIIKQGIKSLVKKKEGFLNLKYLLDDTKISKINYYFDIFIVGLILISLFLYIVLLYLQPGTIAYNIIFSFELILMIFFTIEYILRIYLEKKKKDYMISWYGIADFFAVVPFWLSFIFPIFSGLQFLRILRVFKLYRFFHKYLEKDMTKKVALQLLIIKIIFTMGVLLFISSGLIYTFESPVNGQINSFDDALYFSLMTITTVGFGDIVPVSQFGRIVVMISVLASILIIPVYITSLLRTHMTHFGKRSIVCKICGLKYHDPNAVHCKMCGNVIYQEYDDD